MRKWMPAALVVAAFALSGAAYGRLPARMAIHWGIDGEPNGWAGRGFGAFAVPVVMLALWGLLRALPSIDPRRENYPRFDGSYDVIVIATLTLLLVVHLTTLGTALGVSVPMRRVAPAAVGLFLVAIGNVLPRVRPNWFVGVRTPWTLTDDGVWTRTQRVAGYLLVGAGVLFLVASAVPSRTTTALAIGGTIAAALGAVVYSALRSTRT